MLTQNTLIQKSSIRHGIISLQLFIVLNICTVSHCQLLTNDPNISISISCFKEQVGISEPNKILPKLTSVTEANFLDPIILKLTITNKSIKEISVLYPDLIHRTAILSFRDTTSGQQVPDQVRWIGGISSDYILIQPGKSYEALLYLEQLYPNGISSGSYEIKIQYNAGFKSLLQTNSIFLSFVPQSGDEKQHVANFIKYAREGGDINDIEAFLRENPVGKFRNRIYLKLAREEIGSKKFEAADHILDTIISDKTSTTFQKGEALYVKARLLKDNMGRLNEAIECLEKSPLRSAKSEVEQWKKEKEFQQKKLAGAIEPNNLNN
jgi:hypothetical protein